MMQCSEIQEHLAVHADAELAADLRPIVEAHLAECGPCRAQIDRWQALRRSARRVLLAEAPPGQLEHRLRKSLRASSPAARPRIYRFLGVGLATAAVIILALLFALPNNVAGPAVTAAVTVSPDDFAAVYLNCALQANHDYFGKNGACPRSTAASLAKQLSFTPLVPDLRPEGFELDGVCKCFPKRYESLTVIHAHYRSADARVVSVFTTDRRVKLDTATGPRPAPDPDSKRSYQVARARQNVRVLKWDAQNGSFALCSQMEQDELLQLARSVDFARLPRNGGPALAQATGQ